MKFTIITVSYNSGKDLINTCLSVINQSYKNLELIIIDGKSNDSSLSELKVINDRRLTIYSEKDHGIYDAMNKGIRLAQGDYVIFMNSGDFFANSGVLDEITKKDICKNKYIRTHRSDFFRTEIGTDREITLDDVGNSKTY